MELTLYVLFFFMPLVIIRGFTDVKQTYNSSTLCRRGSNQTNFYEASCKDKVTSSSEVSIIAVTNVWYGAKPRSLQCASNGSFDECCSFIKGQDCLIEPPSAGDLFKIALDCNGAKWCQSQGRRIDASSFCEFPKLFSGLTTYSMFEYQCINTGLIENMCHEGIIQEGNEVYMASNVYYMNNDRQDNCFCTFSTTCGSRIIFEAVDVRLERTPSSQCGEALLFSDVRNPTHNHSVTCYDKYLQMKTLFESQSNLAMADLTILDEKHKGKVWIRVKSSSENATIRLLCGITTNTPIIEKHMCDEDKPTTTTTTTSTTTTVTNFEDIKMRPNCDAHPEQCVENAKDQPDSLRIGYITGIVVGGLVLLFILLVFVVILVKRRRKRDDNIYDVPYNNGNIYETLAPTVSQTPNGFLNESYISNERVIHEANEKRENNPPSGYAYCIPRDQLPDDDGYVRPIFENSRNDAIASNLESPSLQKTSL